MIDALRAFSIQDLSVTQLIANEVNINESMNNNLHKINMCVFFLVYFPNAYKRKKKYIVYYIYILFRVEE